MLIISANKEMLIRVVCKDTGKTFRFRAERKKGSADLKLTFFADPSFIIERVKEASDVKKTKP